MALRRLRAVALAGLLAAPPAWPGGMAERLGLDAPAELLDEEAPGAVARPPGVRVLRDLAYGPDRQQRFDLYLPRGAQAAPVVFMVHGGAWFLGDKAARAVVEHKVARWLPRGFAVVSVNYRLMPKADPLEQARDVARALAAAQRRAAEWGLDRSRFVLMGHSAGAHLVALLAAVPALSEGIVATPWLGTVALDSAAYDLVQLMAAPHPRLYDRAFGADPAYWRAASPYHALTGAARPLLLVCSSRREDACAQAGRLAVRANALGVQAPVLGQDLSHRDLNARLGEEPAYTRAVEAFLGGLDPVLAGLLAE